MITLENVISLGLDDVISLGLDVSLVQIVQVLWHFFFAVWANFTEFEAMYTLLYSMAVLLRNDHQFSA